MKVYNDDRGEQDLERQIETLKDRIKDLEVINLEHKKLNGELRKELEDVREALTRVSGPVH
tara:strand:- start:125 stop:307 length:183 start_codon:yes stop_codon:yes gene_type:complete